MLFLGKKPEYTHRRSLYSLDLLPNDLFYCNYAFSATNNSSLVSEYLHIRILVLHGFRSKKHNFVAKNHWVAGLFFFYTLMPWESWLIMILSVIGIINTLYLSYHSYTKTPVKCLFFPEEWCRTVQQSRYSRMFGVPNSYLGLLMYLAIFFLMLGFLKGSVAFTPAFAVICFGFAFSLFFTYLQAFVLRAFCTWCVLSALEFLLMFVAALSLIS